MSQANELTASLQGSPGGGCTTDHVSFPAVSQTPLASVGGGAEVDVVRDTVTLHPGGRVDSVPKQTVTGHLLSHHTCQNWPGVQTHTNLDGFTSDRVGDISGSYPHSQSKICHFVSVSVCGDWDTSNYHVSITNCLHLLSRAVY